MLQLQLIKQQGNFKLDIRITAQDSGVIALFGRSGCGKSTTINLMAGLLQPDSGRLQLGDTVLFDSASQIDVPCEQRHIGYVFQDARLFPHYTVQGNLEYGLKRAQGSPQFSLTTVVELLGIGPLLSRRPFQLSTGERQRVALGRALLSQPRWLLLDEPLASLDQARRADVLPYLERVRDELKLPMVYVSHQFEEVLQLATHVVLMDEGRVLAQGDLPSVSLHPALRQIAGTEAIGAIIDSQVNHIDHTTGLARVMVGNNHLHVDASHLHTGQQVRLRLLARDLILALHAPQGLSVRNMLHGVLIRLSDDEPNTVLAHVDVGGVELVARITATAARELTLHAGQSLWVLVKAITLRGHLYHRPN